MLSSNGPAANQHSRNLYLNLPPASSLPDRISRRSLPEDPLSLSRRRQVQTPRVRHHAEPRSSAADTSSRPSTPEMRSTHQGWILLRSQKTHVERDLAHWLSR